MNFFNDQIIGNFTMAAGISALIQVVLIALMFMVSRYPYGIISDYFYALTPLLMLPIIFALQKHSGINLQGIETFLLALGVLGIAVVSIGQFLLLVKVIDFKKSVWSNSFGMGLVGIPIFIFTLISLRNASFSSGFNLLGLIMGAAMVIGIPAALFFLESLTEMGHSNFNWRKANPLIYVVTTAGIIAQIGLPVWLLWMASIVFTGNFTFN